MAPNDSDVEDDPAVVNLQRGESIDWFARMREEMNVDMSVPGAEERRREERAARQYSEGDEVETPDGIGVVAEIRTEPFDGPSGDEVDASDDSPAYVVATEDGAAVFRASDIESGSIEVEGDAEPTGDLDDAEMAALAGDDGRQFDYPESWTESPTPNRVILLKAWAGVGGRFSSCRREMAGEVASPTRFCASMKDRVLMWEGWRQ